MKKSQTISKPLNFQFALEIPKLKSAVSKDWDSSFKVSQISVKQELSRLSEHSLLTNCDSSNLSELIDKLKKLHEQSNRNFQNLEGVTHELLESTFDEYRKNYKELIGILISGYPMVTEALSLIMRGIMKIHNHSKKLYSKTMKSMQQISDTNQKQLREIEADYFRLKEIVGPDIIEEEDSQEETPLHKNKSQSTTNLERIIDARQKRQSVFGKAVQEEKKSFIQKHLEIIEIKKEVKERQKLIDKEIEENDYHQLHSIPDSLISQKRYKSLKKAEEVTKRHSLNTRGFQIVDGKIMPELQTPATEYLRKFHRFLSNMTADIPHPTHPSTEEMEEELFKKYEEECSKLDGISKQVIIKLIHEFVKIQKSKELKKQDAQSQTQAPYIVPSQHVELREKFQIAKSQNEQLLFVLESKEEIIAKLESQVRAGEKRIQQLKWRLAAQATKRLATQLKVNAELRERRNSIIGSSEKWTQTEAINLESQAKVGHNEQDQAVLLPPRYKHNTNQSFQPLQEGLDRFSQKLDIRSGELTPTQNFDSMHISKCSKNVLQHQMSELQSSREPVLLKTSVLRSKQHSVSSASAFPASHVTKMVESRPISSKMTSVQLQKQVPASKPQSPSSYYSSNYSIEDFVRFKDAMDKHNGQKEPKQNTFLKHRNTLFAERTNLIGSDQQKRKSVKKRKDGKTVQEKRMKSQLAAFAANMQQMQARGIKFKVEPGINRVSIQRPHSAAAGGTFIKSAFERNVTSPLFRMKNLKGFQ